MSESSSWHTVPERGSSVGMRIVVWLYRGFGGRAAALLLPLIVGYFFMTSGTARRASRRYLDRVYATPQGRRALGSPPGPRHVYRHLLEFGRAILDRVGFWLIDPSNLRIRTQGREHLERARAQGRGVLVLGSHLGSFDAMRFMAATQSPLVVNVLVYTDHARRINRLLDQSEPPRGTRVRVVPIRSGSFEHVLDARCCIERGEVVGILADRVPPNEASRTCRVRFLGGGVALPKGPIRLAALLGCPVLMMTGLRVGERNYEIVVEPLADRIDLPRGERDAALRRYCQAYADHLARQCVRAPYQWFNFFDFFQEPSAGPL